MGGRQKSQRNKGPPSAISAGSAISARPQKSQRSREDNLIDIRNLGDVSAASSVRRNRKRGRSLRYLRSLGGLQRSQKGIPGPSAGYAIYGQLPEIADLHKLPPRYLDLWCLLNIAEVSPCAVCNLCDFWAACRNLTDAKGSRFDNCHLRASRNREDAKFPLLRYPGAWRFLGGLEKSQKGKGPPLRYLQSRRSLGGVPMQ